MITAKMANVVKIIELLGGMDALEDGGAFVITDQRVILRWTGSEDDDDADDEDDGDGSADLKDAFPEYGGADHAYLPLNITRFWTAPDGGIEVMVSHDYMRNGDVAHDPIVKFRTTRETWQSGDWEPLLMEGLLYCLTAETDKQRQDIAEYASGWDRDALGRYVPTVQEFLAPTA